MRKETVNIVIIGGDNSGKTTLSENLCSRFEDSRVLHSPGKHLTPEKMVDFMVTNLNTSGINIFDRIPIVEEDVNGTVLRGVNRLEGILDRVYDKSGITYKDYILNKVDVWVLCFPGFSSILNWGDREQMDGIKEHCSELYSRYILIGGNIANKYKDKYLDYNFNFDKDASIIFEKINNIINRED